MKHIILAATIPLLFFGLLYSGSASANYAQNIGKNLEATKKSLAHSGDELAKIGV